MNSTVDPVTELRLYGAALVVAGIALVGFSAVAPVGLVALVLFFLAPFVWFLQWKYDATVNLGPAVAGAGLLFLLTDVTAGSWFAWVGPLEVSVFVVLMGIFEAVFAPQIVARLPE